MRTSTELQNLSHTNELMGNDGDTIFAMVRTPSIKNKTFSLYDDDDTDVRSRDAGIHV